MERPKVYCMACKHSGAKFVVNVGEWVDDYKCNHPINFSSDYFSEDGHAIHHASEKNKDNHCRDFEDKK